jgi:hypothetical protein
MPILNGTDASLSLKTNFNPRNQIVREEFVFSLTREREPLHDPSRPTPISRSCDLAEMHTKWCNSGLGGVHNLGQIC